MRVEGIRQLLLQDQEFQFLDRSQVKHEVVARSWNLLKATLETSGGAQIFTQMKLATEVTQVTMDTKGKSVAQPIDFRDALDGDYIRSISYPDAPEPEEDDGTPVQGLIPDPWSLYRLGDLAVQWRPHPWTHKVTVFVTTPLLLWTITFLLFGGTALPGGQFFTIFVIIFGGIGLGYIMTAVRLPALLGMLIVGLMVRNIPYFGIAKVVNPAVSSTLRQLALVVILIKAGIGLDPTALRKLKGFVILLATLPSIIEALVVAIGSYLILSFPWTWAFMLGFIISAVSPAVIVPCLLGLKAGGYGMDEEISTIVVAVASIADIMSISLFGITIGFAFAPSGVVELILQGPLELIFGIAFGLVWGYLMGIILLRKTQRSREDKFLHALFTFCGGIIAIFGFNYVGYPGAGPLASLVLAFVAGFLLRKKNLLKHDINDDSLSWSFGVIWYVFQPLLFGLIGCEIDLLALDTRVIGYGALCLIIGIAGRAAITMFLLRFSDFEWKHRIFVCMAWVPKATVQAALGPVGLDAARNVIAAGGDPGLETLGLQVLMISVLAILMTAPCGASLISLLGPKLLSRKSRGKGQSKESASLIPPEDTKDAKYGSC